MNQKINGEALKRLLGQRRLSQKAFAERLGVTPDTVNRWVREKTNVRTDMLKKVKQSLGVEADDLLQPPQNPGSDERTEQLRVRVGLATRNKLQLVCERYHVSMSEIVELAPLLFVIAAEHSLSERNAALMEVERRFEAYEDADSLVPHVGMLLPPLRDEWRENLEEEGWSIAGRDVMGQTTEPPAANPLLLYLERQAESLDPRVVTDVGTWELNSYAIADDTLRELTGIDGDDEDSVEKRRRIQTGEIDLREVQLPERRRPTQKSPEKW